MAKADGISFTCFQSRFLAYQAVNRWRKFYDGFSSGDSLDVKSCLNFKT